MITRIIAIAALLLAAIAVYMVWKHESGCPSKNASVTPPSQPNTQTPQQIAQQNSMASQEAGLQAGVEGYLSQMGIKI